MDVHHRCPSDSRQWCPHRALKRSWLHVSHRCRSLMTEKRTHHLPRCLLAAGCQCRFQSMCLLPAGVSSTAGTGDYPRHRRRPVGTGFPIPSASCVTTPLLSPHQACQDADRRLTVATPLAFHRVRASLLVVAEAVRVSLLVADRMGSSQDCRQDSQKSCKGEA